MTIKEMFNFPNLLHKKFKKACKENQYDFDFGA